MIEFKQIVGRGTRIHEEANKLWFAIMDFKKATELFADPDFDGEPIVVYDPDGKDSDKNGDEPDDGGGEDPDPPIADEKRYVVSGVEVKVAAERVQYLDRNGRLITESLTDYTRKTVRQEYATFDDFLKRWQEADRKALIVDELTEQGVLFEELRAQTDRDLDAFDLICHVVYGQPPLTRKERAENVKKRDVFTRYGEPARAVLDVLLDKYIEEGLAPIEDIGVLRVQPLSDMGTPIELVRTFGGRTKYLAAVRVLADSLYEDVA